MGRKLSADAPRGGSRGEKKRLAWAKKDTKIWLAGTGARMALPCPTWRRAASRDTRAAAAFVARKRLALAYLRDVRVLGSLGLPVRQVHRPLVSARVLEQHHTRPRIFLRRARAGFRRNDLIGRARRIHCPLLGADVLEQNDAGLQVLLHQTGSGGPGRGGSRRRGRDGSRGRRRDGGRTRAVAGGRIRVHEGGQPGWRTAVSVAFIIVVALGRACRRRRGLALAGILLSAGGIAGAVEHGTNASARRLGGTRDAAVEVSVRVPV